VIVGTLINSIAILSASLIGTFFGSKMNERLRKSIMNVLGIPVIVIGISMALKTQNVLIPIISIVIGTAIGELIEIERRLKTLSSKFEMIGAGKFSEGFVSGSLLFCIGPLAILGPIQEGLSGDTSILLAKSILDSVAAIALASVLGIGVAFSSISVFAYQSFFAVLASELGKFITEKVISELTSTGGMLIIGVGINLLEIGNLRVGNMLPALIFAPILVLTTQYRFLLELSPLISILD